MVAAAGGPVGPRRRQRGLAVHDLGEELVVQDVDRCLTHALNPTAALLWQLCDGTRRRDELVGLFVEGFGLDPSVAARDVDAGLDLLRRAHLLEVPEGGSPS